MFKVKLIDILYHYIHIKAQNMTEPEFVDHQR